MIGTQMMDGDTAAGAAIGSLKRPTATERLYDEKKHLEGRLKDVNEAIAAIEKNPDVQAAFDAIQKLGHI